MFTGIVEETGKIQTVVDKKVVIEYHEALENTKAILKNFYQRVIIGQE